MAMKDFKQSSLLNALLASALTAALFYFTVTVMPFLQVFLLFPFVTLYVSEGPKWTVFSMALTLLVGGFLVGFDQALVTSLYFVPVALAMGEMIRRKIEVRDEILLTSLIIFAATLVQLYLASRMAGGAWLDSLQKSAQSALEESLGSRGLNVSEADLPALQYQISVALEMLVHSIPGILYVSSLFTALVTGLLSHFISRSSGIGVRPLALADFELSRFWTVILLLASLIVFILPGNSYNGNALIVALALLLINGLGYIDFRLQWRMIHWMGRAILYFFFIFLVLPCVPALFIGIGDGLFGFRAKIREKGHQHGQNHKK